MDKDILRNGSGINDYTAYNAIKSYEKGEKKMEIQAGEIYEVKRKDGDFATALVISVHENTCNILYLYDKMTEGAVKVISRGVKYTDVQRIQYTFNTLVRTFVRKLKDEEFAEIMDKVRESLGFEKNEPIVAKVEAVSMGDDEISFYESKINELEAQKAEYMRNYENMETRLKEAVDAQNVYESQSMKAAIEKDLYKKMYDDLLEKVIA